MAKFITILILLTSTFPVWGIEFDADNVETDTQFICSNIAMSVKSNNVSTDEEYRKIVESFFREYDQAVGYCKLTKDYLLQNPSALGKAPFQNSAADLEKNCISQIEDKVALDDQATKPNANMANNLQLTKNIKPSAYSSIVNNSPIAKNPDGNGNCSNPNFTPGIVPSNQYDKCGEDPVVGTPIDPLAQLSNFFSDGGDKLKSYEKFQAIENGNCEYCFRLKYNIKHDAFLKNKGNYFEFGNKVADAKEKLKNQVAANQMKNTLAYFSKAAEINQDVNMWRPDGAPSNSRLSGCNSSKEIVKRFKESSCAKGLSEQELNKKLEDKFSDVILPSLPGYSGSNKLELKDKFLKGKKFEESLDAYFAEIEDKTKNRSSLTCPENVFIDREQLKADQMNRLGRSSEVLDSALSVLIKNKPDIVPFDDSPLWVLEHALKEPEFRSKVFEDLAEKIFSPDGKVKDKKLKEFFDILLSEGGVPADIKSVADLDGMLDLEGFIEFSIDTDARLALAMNEEQVFNKYFWPEVQKGKNSHILGIVNNVPFENLEKAKDANIELLCMDFYREFSESLCFTDAAFASTGDHDVYNAANDMMENAKDAPTPLKENLKMVLSASLCEKMQAQDSAGVSSIEEFLNIYLKDSKRPNAVGPLFNQPENDSFQQGVEDLACNDHTKDDLMKSYKIFRTSNNLSEMSVAEMETMAKSYQPPIPPPSSSNKMANSGSTGGSSNSSEPKSSLRKSESNNNGAKYGFGDGEDPFGDDEEKSSSGNSGANTLKSMADAASGAGYKSASPGSNNKESSDKTSENDDSKPGFLDNGSRHGTVFNSFNPNENEGNFQAPNYNYTQPVLTPQMVQENKKLVDAIEDEAGVNLDKKEEKLLEGMNPDELKKLFANVNSSSGLEEKMKKVEAELAKAQANADQLKAELEKKNLQSRVKELEDELANEKKKVFPKETVKKNDFQGDFGQNTGSLGGFDNSTISGQNNSNQKKVEFKNNTSQNYDNSQVTNDSGASFRAFASNSAPQVQTSSGGRNYNAGALVLNSESVKEYYKANGSESKELKNEILKEFITKYESQAITQIMEQDGKIVIKVPTENGKEILIKEEDITDKELISKIKKMKEIGKKETELKVAKNELAKEEQVKRNVTLLSLQLKLLQGKRSLTKQ